MEGPDGGTRPQVLACLAAKAHTMFGGPWRMESIRDPAVFLQAYTRPPDYTAAQRSSF